MRTLEIKATHPWPVLLPDVLKAPPISHHGNVAETIGKFGGTDQLRNAVNPVRWLPDAA